MHEQKSSTDSYMSTAHNLQRSPHEIDVHRLTAPEALVQVKRGIRFALIQDAPQLRVICGKGLHSVNQTPVLKKAIVDEMKKCVVFVPHIICSF